MDTPSKHSVLRLAANHRLEIGWEPGSMRSRALLLSGAHRVEELADFGLEAVAVEALARSSNTVRASSSRLISAPVGIRGTSSGDLRFTSSFADGAAESLADYATEAAPRASFGVMAVLARLVRDEPLKIECPRPRAVST